MKLKLIKSLGRLILAGISNVFHFSLAKSIIECKRNDWRFDTVHCQSSQQSPFCISKNMLEKKNNFFLSLDMTKKRIETKGCRHTHREKKIFSKWIKTVVETWNVGEKKGMRVALLKCAFSLRDVRQPREKKAATQQNFWYVKSNSLGSHNIMWAKRFA